MQAVLDMLRGVIFWVMLVGAVGALVWLTLPPFESFDRVILSLVGGMAILIIVFLIAISALPR